MDLGDVNVNQVDGGFIWFHSLSKKVNHLNILKHFDMTPPGIVLTILTITVNHFKIVSNILKYFDT